VTIGIVFANADPAAFALASVRAQIAAAVALAAGVAASSVSVKRVLDSTNNVLVFAASGGPAARRLAAANIEVSVLVSLPDAGAASSLGAMVAAAPARFSSSVLASLQSANAATFGAVSALVPLASLQFPAAAAQPATAPGLGSGGVVIGAAVGGGLTALALMIAAIVAYYRFFKVEIAEVTGSRSGASEVRGPVVIGRGRRLGASNQGSAPGRAAFDPLTAANPLMSAHARTQGAKGRSTQAGRPDSEV